MINYTHKNHFRFGWGDGTYNFNEKHKPYWVDFGRAEYTPVSFKDECLRSARLIAETASRPILICFSGGIDSEIIVRSFQEQGIPFEVAIMQINYKGMTDLNSHDTQYAFDYVNSHKIKFKKFNFDLESYIRDVYPEKAKIYGAYFGVLVHNEIIKNFPEYHCILGGGDIKLKRHRFNGRPTTKGLFIEEGIVSISGLETALENNTTVSNRFFMHTPEIMLAWLLDKDVAHWIRLEEALAGGWYGNMNYHLLKAFTLYRHWPDMVIRPKYNGYEQLGLWKDSPPGIVQDQTLIKIFRDLDQEYGKTNDVIINYETLLEKLLPIT